MNNPRTPPAAPQHMPPHSMDVDMANGVRVFVALGSPTMHLVDNPDPWHRTTMHFESSYPFSVTLMFGTGVVPITLTSKRIPLRVAFTPEGSPCTSQT